MFSLLPDLALPDLTPRDSHSLWYTSSRNPYANATRPTEHDPSSDNNNGAAGGPGGTFHRGATRPSQAAIENSPLARLRADEQYVERRRLNISNFGSTWLKPPGVSKSLYQMREERREAEEHAEAMRREQLAQQLAEAGGGAPGMDDLGMVDMDGEPMEEDEEAGEGMRDLDDDIPDADADADGFGFDGADSDVEEEEDDEEQDINEQASVAMGSSPAETRHQMRNMRATEDRVRQLMARNQDVESDVYGAEEEVDEEDRGDILEEDDLAHDAYLHEGEPGMDMDMDANLDDDVPEAESAGYEHTDTEAELSSSDDGSQDVAYGARAPQVMSRFRGSLPRASMQSGRGSLPRSEVDISSLLSRDGSSITGSSPPGRRRNQ